MLENLREVLPPERGWTRDDFKEERDHEEIVHPRALEPIWKYTKGKIAREALIQGTGKSVKDFGSAQTISWADFLIVTQNFFLEFGQEDRVLFEVTGALTDLPGYSIGHALAGFFANPHVLYRMAARWFAPMTFPCVYPNKINALSNGQYGLEMRLKPGFSACAHFFVLNRAMIVTATRLIGLKDAVVSMSVMGDHAHFMITPPTSGTLVARARRSWDMLFRGGASMVEHLEGQFEAVQKVNDDLQSKIRELELIQHELKRAKAQYIRAINGTREGIWELAFGDDTLTVSPRWLEIMSDEEELERGKSISMEDWRALIHSQDLPSFDESLQRHLADQTLLWDHTFRVSSERDELRWVRVRARKSYLNEHSKGVAFLAGSIVDVTLAERTRQDLPLLLQESPYPLCVVSREDGKLLFLNKAFYKLLDREEHSLDEQDIVSFMTEDDWDICQRELATGASFQGEQSWFMGEGEGFKEVRLRAQAINLLSGPSVLVHAEDLAERRAEQARHIQMDRIMSMGTMAASIGHEINNPMAFVQSNLELAINLLPMLERPEKDADAEVYDDLQFSLNDALQGAQRVVKIIRNLRSFTQHSKSTEPTQELVTLDSLVGPALSMVRAELAQFARLEIVSDFESKEVHVHLDASYIVQILTNLLINAVHAIEGAALSDPDMSHRHCVTLQLKREPNDTLVFAVTDTGVGIAKEDQDRIFAPFFTSKKQGKGTGLGLYICKMLSEELGGELSVESEYGEGATFTLRFPHCIDTVVPLDGEVEQAPAVLQQPPKRQESSDEKPTLLLVDDERVLLKSFARVLGQHFQVQTCLDGADALELLLSGYSPQLILCDVNMPIMGGVEFFDELQQVRPELCDRMIFMTGGSSKKLREKIGSRGVDLLEKPLEQPSLLQLVERVHSA